MRLLLQSPLPQMVLSKESKPYLAFQFLKFAKQHQLVPVGYGEVANLNPLKFYLP
jgi:hypothetical protein